MREVNKIKKLVANKEKEERKCKRNCERYVSSREYGTK